MHLRGFRAWLFTVAVFCCALSRASILYAKADPEKVKALGARPEIIVMNDNASEEVQRAQSYLDRYGIKERMMTVQDYPPELQSKIRDVYLKVAELVRETSRQKDGKQVFVRLVDSRQPNAAFFAMDDGKVMVEITRGFLEKAPSDDFIVGVIGHEFEHGHSELQIRADNEKNADRAKGIQRAVEGEVDVKGAQRAIEQGRNPFASLTAFEERIERNGGFSQLARSHIGDRARANALAVKLTKDTRLDGGLSDFRLNRDTAKDISTDVVDFMRKEIFDKPSYLASRMKIAKEVIASFGGVHAKNYYAGLYTWLKRGGTHEPPRPPGGSQSGFHPQMIRALADVLDTLPVETPTAEMLEIQTGTNRAMAEIWNRASADAEAISPQQRPGALSYLHHADERTPVVDVENPAKAFRRWQKANDEFSKIPAQNTIDREAKKRDVLRAQQAFNEAMAFFEPDGSRSTSIDQVIKKFEAVEGGYNAQGLALESLQDFRIRSKDDVETAFQAYRAAADEFGLRFKGDLHAAYIREGLRHKATFDRYWATLIDPKVKPSEFGFIDKAVFMSMQDMVSPKMASDFFSAMEKRVAALPQLTTQEAEGALEGATKFMECFSEQNWSSSLAQQATRVRMAIVEKAPLDSIQKLTKIAQDANAKLADARPKQLFDLLDRRGEKHYRELIAREIEKVRKATTIQELIVLNGGDYDYDLPIRDKWDTIKKQALTDPTRLRIADLIEPHIGPLEPWEKEAFYRLLPFEPQRDLQLKPAQRLKLAQRIAALATAPEFAGANNGLLRLSRVSAAVLGPAPPYKSPAFGEDFDHTKIAKPSRDERAVVQVFDQAASKNPFFFSTDGKDGRLGLYLTQAEARRNPFQPDFTNHNSSRFRKTVDTGLFLRTYFESRLEKYSSRARKAAVELATTDLLSLFSALEKRITVAEGRDAEFSLEQLRAQLKESFHHWDFSKTNGMNWDFYDGAAAAFEKHAQKTGIPLAQIWPDKMTARIPDSGIDKLPYDRLAKVVDFEVRAGGWSPDAKNDRMIRTLVENRRDRQVAALVMKPAFVEQVADSNLKLELARIQLKDRWEVQHTDAIKRGQAPTAVRPLIKDIRETIEAQFPHSGIERDTIIAEVENSIRSTRAESERFDSLRLRNALSTVQGAEYSDAMDHLSRAIGDPKRQLELISYLIGRTDRVPARPSNYTRAQNQKDWERLMKESKNTYLRAGAVQRAGMLVNFFDERKGVLSTEETRSTVRSWLLGKRDRNPVLRRTYDEYLTAVRPSEAKLLVTGAITQYNPRSLNPVPLSSVTDAFGAFGGKFAQILAQTGMIDSQTRKELGAVHNNIQRPDREAATLAVQKALGKNAHLIEHVGEVINSGTINYLVEVSIRNPATGKVENLLLRLQKNNVGPKIFNENTVWAEVAPNMARDSDPKIRRAGRVLEQIRGQTYKTLQPGGIELDMNHENSPEVVKAARTTYERATPDPESGLRSRITTARTDLLSLLDSEYSGRAMFVDRVNVTEWEKIPDKALRRAAARQAQALEVDGALAGVVDRDGHKGNWMVDLSKGELVRTDTAQMKTTPPPPEVREDLKEILRGLLDPRKLGDRTTDQAVLGRFSSVFDLRGELAAGIDPEALQKEIKEVVQKAMKSKDFPAAHSPVDRLLYIQGEVETHFIDEKKVKNFSMPVKEDLAEIFESLRRAASLDEFAGRTSFVSLMANRLDMDIRFYSGRMAYQWSKDRAKELARDAKDRAEIAAKLAKQTVTDKLGTVADRVENAYKIKINTLDEKIGELSRSERCPSMFSELAKMYMKKKFPKRY